MKITISIDPTFAHLGPLALTWHGLFSMLAIVVAVVYIRRGLLRHGISMARYDEVAFWTVIGGIIGARLFFFFDHPGDLFHDPLQFFAFTDGGLAIYGALIGGFVAVALLSRIYHFGFGEVIDQIAPALLLAQAIGRQSGFVCPRPPAGRADASVPDLRHAGRPAAVRGAPAHPPAHAAGRRALRHLRRAVFGRALLHQLRA
jgi:phosphatidylglycerol:prolipoprotein diacylglycerol transferase